MKRFRLILTLIGVWCMAGPRPWIGNCTGFWRLLRPGTVQGLSGKPHGQKCPKMH